MVTADSRPEKESFVLVTFIYGEGLSLSARYTDFDRDYPGFTSEPRMALRIPANDGILSKRKLRIMLPLDAFTSGFSTGAPHSPTFVQVKELSVGLTPGEQVGARVLFSGRVSKTVQNYQGKSGQVAFFAKSRKGRLDIPLGLQCNHQCVWNVYKGKCGASQAAFSVVAEIDSVDGLEVTATNPALALKAVGDDRYWKRGWLEKGGLRISIRDYDGGSDPTLFYLSDPPPTDWIGGTNDITFVAGCDKSVETCRGRFNQEATFMGIGYAIPPYQPNTETPS